MCRQFASDTRELWLLFCWKSVKLTVAGLPKFLSDLLQLFNIEYGHTKVKFLAKSSKNFQDCDPIIL